MKKLLLVRHAKSYWDLEWLDDIERPLNQRGKREAPIMGAVLTDRDLRPDTMIVSPAARTMATARILAGKLGFPPERIRVEERLYGAGTAVLLEVMSELSETVETAMFVGHNPETTMLANRMTGAGIDNVPTTGVVGIDLDIVSWTEVVDTRGELFMFETPKQHRTEER